jgi:hypothetical protein
MQNQIAKILALNEIGSVNQILQKFDPKLGTNEGIGKYSYLAIDSPTGKPFTQATEITIPLTNTNVDIVEFHRSFFTLTVDAYLQFDTPDNFAKFFRHQVKAEGLFDNPQNTGFAFNEFVEDWVQATQLMNDFCSEVHRVLQPSGARAM